MKQSVLRFAAQLWAMLANIFKNRFSLTKVCNLNRHIFFRIKMLTHFFSVYNRLSRHFPFQCILYINIQCFTNSRKTVHIRRCLILFQHTQIAR